MTTAILLGYGPDVDLALDTPGFPPAGAKLYWTNISGYLPPSRLRGLPVVNVFDMPLTMATLKDDGISRIVTIGSLKLTGAYQFLRNAVTVWKAKPLIFALMKGERSSDEARKIVFEQVKNEFQFPLICETLPFLFSNEDVAINPKAELLDAALSHPLGFQKDAKLEVQGQLVKMLRVDKEPSSSLVSRRLYPKKLEKICEEDGIRHVFFERERTIVVDLDAMRAYAAVNSVTLQSFRGTDRQRD